MTIKKDPRTGTEGTSSGSSNALNIILKEIRYYFNSFLTGHSNSTGVKDLSIAKVTILGSKECKARFPDVTDNHICITTPDKEYCKYIVDFTDPKLMWKV